FLYMSCRDLHLQEVENVGSRQQLYEVREDNRSKKSSFKDDGWSCVLCKKKGHKLDFCYYNKLRRNAGKNKKNVIYVDCDSTDGEKEENDGINKKLMSSTFIQSVSTRDMGSYVKINNLTIASEMNCLIDSGADINMIRPELVRGVKRIPVRKTIRLQLQMEI
ncbi:hypothetical protein NGRA_3589, partial [Nosema granulosis]